MTVNTSAYARAGLIGNPSDGYYGKTISFVIKNFSARVSLCQANKICIIPHQNDHSEFNSMEELVNDVRFSGYYGGIRLIKATIKRFYEFTLKNEIHLEKKNFIIKYDSNIPLRVGLAGSSAIVTAALRALMAFYEVEIPMEIQPNLILEVETDELGISAGLQDRVAQVYEGLIYMDFNREHFDEFGYGIYKKLDVSLLKNVFIAFQKNLSEGTEVFHNNIRDRWDNGDLKVRHAMLAFAEYAEKFNSALKSGDKDAMYHLINQNFDLRASIYKISNSNWKLINTARNIGACAKFSGSGGAVVGLYKDHQMLKNLEQAYEKTGAELIVPEIN